MPSPVSVLGAPGNLIGGPSGLSVARSTTVAAFLDLSTCIEGRVSCEATSGATAPTSGTTFSAYAVYGNSAANTLQAAVAAGTASTSLSVSSKAGLQLGQKILLQRAGTAPQPGEIVTISAAITGSGPYTVPITGTGTNSGTVNSYSTGDAVYLFDQTATATALPTNSTGSFPASTDASVALFLGTGQWCIAAANADTTSGNTVTVTVGVDKVTGFA